MVPGAPRHIYPSIAFKSASLIQIRSWKGLVNLTKSNLRANRYNESWMFGLVEMWLRRRGNYESSNPVLSAIAYVVLSHREICLALVGTRIRTS